MKRSASPVSLSEAAKIAAQEGPRKKRMLTDRQQEHDGSRLRARNPRLQTLQTSTPITPQIEEEATSRPRDYMGWQDQPFESRISASSSATLSNPHLEDEHQILSPRSDGDRSEQGMVDVEESPTFAPTPLNEWQSSRRRAIVTPLRTSSEHASVFTNEMRDIHHQHHRGRPHPQAVNIAAAQDASLPSPSLSPVTAAAQIHARSQFVEHESSRHLSDLEANQMRAPPQQHLSRINTREHLNPNLTGPLDNQVGLDTQIGLVNGLSNTTSNAPPSGSLMCIPQIVDDFESMPEDVKKYVMHHLLRRCSKSVLHFIAGTINPALKCDFLRYLPTELCETILAHLDVKSLCAAAQVSKKWRQQVDLSERVWERLFYDNGYALQEGELNRAIREGWGWQTNSDPGQAEQDLSLQLGDTFDEPSLTSPTHESSTAGLSRSRKKGKAKIKLFGRSSRKRKHTSFLDSPDMEDDALLVRSSATDGPFAAASAAAAAIPLPPHDLHLWKSIFMRHHIIRRTWMQDHVAPRHIAFRAHQEHVVTCLQFDSDKILTGSDDANINVYDTQTGALRAKLEGHEGGVWALQYEGNVLVSGSTDRAVRVWDIERGVCTHTFQGHTSTVRCLQILLPTPVGTGFDGRPILMPKQPLIITGSRDSHLRVWKLPKPGDAHVHQAGPAQDESTESSYFVRTLTGHHHSVRAIAAHADTLVSGSYDCTVRVWKISTGETLHRLQGHAQKVYSVVLDNKRNRCISGSMDNVVKVWSLETGMSLFNLEGHQSLVGLLDLQQDRLVSAAADSTLRIWDPDNGQCKSTLTAHTGAITCFQHDGQKVISGSDRTLKMWNVTTGKFVKDLLTDLSGVWQVKFNERRCVAAVQRNNLTFIEVSSALRLPSLAELTASVKGA